MNAVVAHVPNLRRVNAIRAHFVRRAQAITLSNPPTLPELAKRTLWLRGMGYRDLERETGLTWKHWASVIEGAKKWTPGTMRHFLAAIGATPLERKTLTQLAARAAGWELE